MLRYLDLVWQPDLLVLAGREFDKAAKNPTQLYSYLLAGGNLPAVPRRPGPKPRSGLC